MLIYDLAARLGAECKTAFLVMNSSLMSCHQMIMRVVDSCVDPTIMLGLGKTLTLNISTKPDQAFWRSLTVKSQVQAREADERT